MTASLDPYIGPAAGVGASLLWAFTTLLFTTASQRLGVTRVNVLRILFAVVWLGFTHRLLAGTWIPAASGRQVVLLALSGGLGLSIGDWALFAAFVRIGPRLTTLVCTTSPIFAALFAWLALGETLSVVTALGMLLTIAGVAWVVLERPTQGRAVFDSHRTRGVLLALAAAACQAGGYLLSKQAMHSSTPPEQHLPAQTATLIRMFFAAISVIPLILWLAARARVGVIGNPASCDPRRQRAGYVYTLCGSLVGPFFGVWMSLVACDRVKLGVAQTLISLTPVFILPLVVWVYKERVTLRAVLGACIAVAGTALLFLPQSA